MFVIDRLGRLSVMAAVLIVLTAGPAAAETDLKTEKAQQGYAVGYNIGQRIVKDSLAVDVEALLQGVKDGMTKATPKMDEAARNKALQALQEEFMAQQKQAKEAEANKNLADGKAFLESNKLREGVKTTASGLQYKVLKSGDGKAPSAEDTVEVHYEGRLIDGKVFDSSIKRGKPARFPVNGVIKGWTEALQMMKEGDKWEIYIPAELGYGANGAGQAIPPNAALVFEVELIKVEKKEKK